MTIMPVDADVPAARARLGAWPHDPDVVQIVVLDHHMVPTAEDVATWVASAEQAQPRAIRTGALFPPAAAAFRAAGFHAIDTLALLEAPLERRRPGRPARGGRRTQRMRPHQLGDVAVLDRETFGDPWGNDEPSLREITHATPRHRGRVVLADGRIDGFAISGLSGTSGYLQRIAVHPAARRQGIARLLVDDALRWLQRRGAARVLVNTAADNEPALALYHGIGFERRPEALAILELSLR